MTSILGLITAGLVAARQTCPGAAQGRDRPARERPSAPAAKS